MEIGGPVEDVVYPDGEGADGVVLVDLRTGFVLLQPGRGLHIGPSENTRRQQMIRGRYPAARNQILPDIKGRRLSPGGRPLRENEGQFLQGQHRSLVEGSVMVLQQAPATGIRVEIAGIGNPVHLFLLLAAEQQGGKMQGGVLEAIFSQAFIQTGRCDGAPGSLQIAGFFPIRGGHSILPVLDGRLFLSGTGENGRFEEEFPRDE